MALGVCKECGSQISKKAKQCPKCGIKISSMSVSKFIMITIVAIVLVSALGEGKRDDQSTLHYMINGR
jgi:predicted ATP-dependent serine protease